MDDLSAKDAKSVLQEFCNDLKLEAVNNPPSIILLNAFAVAGGLIEPVIDGDDEDENIPAQAEINKVTIKEKENVKEIKKVLEEIKEKFVKIDEAMIVEINNVITKFTGILKDIVSKMLTLHVCMFEYIRRPDEKTKHLFIEEYENNSPYLLMMNVTFNLQNDKTSPLYHAMNVDFTRNSATGKNWRNICIHLMNRMMYVQAFSEGLMGTPKDVVKEKLDKMTELWKKGGKAAQKTIDNFVHYWPLEVETLAKNMVDKEGLSNQEKIYRLREQLREIKTTDHFFIIAHNTHGQSVASDESRRLQVDGTVKNSDGWYNSLIIYRIHEGQKDLSGRVRLIVQSYVENLGNKLSEEHLTMHVNSIKRLLPDELRVGMVAILLKSGVSDSFISNTNPNYVCIVDVVVESRRGWIDSSGGRIKSGTCNIIVVGSK